MFFIDLSPFILVSLSSILFAKSKEKEETQEQEEKPIDASIEQAKGNEELNINECFEKSFFNSFRKANILKIFICQKLNIRQSL